MSLMVIPILTSVMRESFSQAPLGEREGAYALGSTRWGMIRSVVLPFGKGGIIGGTMLGLGRALGETIVVILIISPVYTANFHFLQSGGNSISYLIANLVGGVVLVRGVGPHGRRSGPLRPHPDRQLLGVGGRGPVPFRRGERRLSDHHSTWPHGPRGGIGARRRATASAEAPQAGRVRRRHRSSTWSGAAVAGVCGGLPARSADRPVGTRRPSAWSATWSFWSSTPSWCPSTTTAQVVRDAIMTVLMASCAVIAFGALGTVVFFTLAKGWAALVHLNFYTQDMSKAGPLAPLTVGGMGHALIGHRLDGGDRRGADRPPRPARRRCTST